MHATRPVQTFCIQDRIELSEQQSSTLKEVDKNMDWRENGSNLKKAGIGTWRGNGGANVVLQKQSVAFCGAAFSFVCL